MSRKTRAYHLTSYVTMLACVATSNAAARASWEQAPHAFVRLRDDARGDLQRFVTQLETVGGHVSVVWPPNAALVRATDAQLAAPPLQRWIASTHRDHIDEAILANWGSDALPAARAWNVTRELIEAAAGELPCAPAAPTSVTEDAPPQELDSSRLGTAQQPAWPDARRVPVRLGPPPSRADKPSSRMPFGAQYYDTSEFMMGWCAVGVWLLEAAGSQYDWSQQEQDRTLAGVMSALDNWVAKGGAPAALTFYVDVHTAVPVSGVPIENPMSSDQLWVDEFLTAAGFAGANAWEKCFAYNNSLRDAFNAHWCFSIVIVDSDATVNQGLFAGGGYAWAYLGGPWIYMSRYSTWAYNSRYYFSAVPMHEMGHIFYATDEYDNLQDWSGYLRAHDSPNTILCVMNRNEYLWVCVQTQRQLGWRDLDLDGIHDILDTEPSVTITPLCPNPTHDYSPSWTGSVSVTTIPNNNPNSHYAPEPHGITLVTIAEVQCRPAGWPWTRAVALDGAFDGYVEDFGWTSPPLSNGDYTLEVRARTSLGNWLLVPATASFRVEGSPVAAGEVATSNALALEPIGPNPVAGFGLVRFSLPSPQQVLVSIYDTAGRRVRVLADGHFGAGASALAWDGRDDGGFRLPTGVYHCQLRAQSGIRARSIVLVH